MSLPADSLGATPVPASDASAATVADGPRTPLIRRVMKGGGWALFGNMASQAIRFGGNLCLTRLLFPEAFGLMAIAQSVLAAAHLLSDVGLSQSVVRSHRGQEPEFLDTIWTMQIAKAGLIFLILLIAAPITAHAYHQPQLLQLVPAVGLAAFVSGFGSTKVALVNRKIELGRLTTIELGSQLFGMAVTIGWALAVPTPWALVGGNLASSAALVWASHAMLAGPRNRFAWNREVVSEVWRFGGWVMLSSAVTFLAGEGRNLLNAALVGPRVVGLLVLSSTLALVVWNAIQQVSGRVLFPAYSEVWRERPKALPSVVERSRRLQLLGGCAVATVFALSAPTIIGLLYDPRYRDAGIFLQIQAVGTIFSFLSASYTGVLWAIGRPGLSTVLLAVQVALVGTCLVAGHALGGSIGLVTGTALSSVLMYPITAGVYARFGLFQPRTDWAPILLGALLAFYVYHFGSWHAGRY